MPYPKQSMPSKTKKGHNAQGLHPQPASQAAPSKKDGVSGNVDVLIPEVDSNGTVHYKRTEIVGPIPPPDLLKEYDRVFPGLGERIIKGWEVEGQHRREMEKNYYDLDQYHLKETHRESRLGTIFAFIITMTAIVGGMIAAINGAQWPGGIISTAGLAALVYAFRRGTSLRGKEDVKQNNNEHKESD